MPLLKSEIAVLKLLERKSTDAVEPIAQAIGLGLPSVQTALDHLVSLGCVNWKGITAGDRLDQAIVITPAGREHLRILEHARQEKLIRFLDKLFWSVVVPIVVAGATAYYVALPGVKK